MIPDGRYTAVVDSIEETLASLELSDEDARYNLVVNEDELPDDARHTNAILTVEVVAEELVEVTYEPEETERREEEAQSRFERLSKRPPRDDES